MMVFKRNRSTVFTSSPSAMSPSPDLLVLLGTTKSTGKKSQGNLPRPFVSIQRKCTTNLATKWNRDPPRPCIAKINTIFNITDYYSMDMGGEDVGWECHTKVTWDL